MDALNIALAVTSTALAVLALVLSILFYRWADKAAQESGKSLIELRSAIRSLDQLVSDLRSDSFSLVRSAYTDMSKLATLGVTRGSDHHVELTEVRTAARVPAVTGDKVESHRHPDRSSKREQPGIDDQKMQEVSLQLGRLMMARRGKKFHEAVAELRGRINEIFDNEPTDRIITTGEIAARLKPEGWDIGEVVYVLATMQETKELKRGDEGAPEARS